VGSFIPEQQKHKDSILFENFFDSVLDKIQILTNPKLLDGSVYVLYKYVHVCFLTFLTVIKLVELASLWLLLAED